MEQETIHIALKNLRQTTDIEAYWEENGPLDGRLHFNYNNKEYNFVVEAKRELRAHQLHQVEEYANKYEHFILIANRIFPKIKEELKDKEIAYIEGNGNVFLKKEGLFLYVNTNKALNIEKNKGNRAFTKTGLKVLFYLLQHRDAINLTQRELAEETNVALGNIPQIIDGLKDTGFLIPLNNRDYVWERRKELLGRWITEYATTLRPKLKKERYTLEKPWKDLKFNTHLTVWGGEAAADIITNYLRPEKLLIYTHENRLNLIKNYGLIPKEGGEVEVLEIFWKQENEITAPPLLVYADLLIEGGKRNKETAEIIFNELIRQNL